MITSLTAEALTLSELFERLFSPQALQEVFSEKYQHAASKGIDRINGFQYTNRISADVTIISNKCLAGEYRFSPYLETLKLKGRGKKPRVISMPTIRDRIVLNQLNQLLAAAFPTCVPRNIANSYIRAIAEDLADSPAADTYVCGLDIKTFYDAIQHVRLLKRIEEGCDCRAAVALVRHAILTPTVPKNTRRNQYKNYRPKIGVPQGLSISNILAAIYMADVDTEMAILGVKYYRYVDDVFMYGTEQEIRKAHKSLGDRLRRRGLSLHPLGSGKGQIAPLSKPFGYLLRLA